MTRRSGSLAPGFGLVALASAIVVGGCGAPSPGPVTGTSVGTGRFVSDDAIAAVKTCTTTGDEVIASFGEPSGRGLEDGFTTLQWMNVVGATDGVRRAVKSQTIQVWVDAHGLVAAIAVNPAGVPSAPKACKAKKA